jgi:hypothetical protein
VKPRAAGGGRRFAPRCERFALPGVGLSRADDGRGAVRYRAVTLKRWSCDVNPIRFVTRPIKNIVDAIVMPFQALFVVGLCWVINAMTFHGNWWVKWVAFGMGIAVIVAFARAAKTLVLLALLAWGGWWLHKRYGAAAKAKFDEWAARTQPQAAQVLELIRTKPETMAG